MVHAWTSTGAVIMVSLAACGLRRRSARAFGRQASMARQFAA
jgi:hypothetical protein